MAWYKQPIRPYDPVVEYDAPLQTIRYLRSEFNGSGMYSYPEPPNQPQDQWAALINVMPPVRGNFEKRWGYVPWSAVALGFVPYRQADYANELSSPVTRKSIWMAPNGVSALNEDGTVFNAAPIGVVAAEDTHMAYSRSVAYFTDGVTSGKKWNGSASGGNSKWGIDITNANAPVTVTTTVTPSTGNSVDPGDGVSTPWIHGSPLFTYPPYWNSDVVSTFYGSYFLNLIGCGYALPGGSTVVSVTYNVSYTVNPQHGPGDSQCQIQFGALKGGAQYQPPTGLTGIAAAASGSLSFTLTNGSGGVVFDYTDINASNFGAWFRFYNGYSTDRTCTITACTVSVTYVTTAPGIGVVVTNSNGGSVNLTNGRVYFYVFRNSQTTHMSDLSAPSVSTGPVTNGTVALSNIGVSTDPQVDLIWILATADGGDQTLLYFLAELPNGTATYTDDTSELDLLANNIVQQTDVNGNLIGVADNDPPPPGDLVVKHQGRLFVAKNATLYCSKSLSELTTSTGLIAGRYEESWPPENNFDVSDDADVITALISDGTTLYIGTPRHIRRLNGDSPADFQFQQVTFNEAGIVNEDALSVVYADGSPSGCIWITPDLRCIHSDFNTYTDIGGPIQDLLLQINPKDLDDIRVNFYSRGPYDECVVAFNTSTISDWNNTWAVYDMRAQTWLVWQLATVTTALAFRITDNGIHATTSGMPQWLFSDTSGNLFQILPTAYTDNGTAITSLIQTPWYHFGTAVSRKWLNELELITNDPNILVSVDGATTATDFTSPFSLVNDAIPVVSPLGPLKVFLATTGAHHRFYRTTLISTAQLTSPLLETLNYEVIPVHNL